MPIRYEVWSTLRGGEAYNPANIYPSSSETITVNQFSEFSLRLSYYDYTYSSPEPSTWEFKYCKMNGYFPDKTTFITDNFETTEANYYPYGTNLPDRHHYYVDIPFDSRFSSQIGSTKYSVIFMDANNSVVASMPFQITVQSPDEKGLLSKTYELDFCTKEKPLIIKLSQGDINFKFTFRVKTKYGTIDTTGISLNNTCLRGILPNGIPLNLLKVPTTNTNYYGEGLVWTITLDGRLNGIGKLITSVPGEYIVAFSFCNYDNKNTEQLTIQRIKFVIEAMA